MQEEKERENTQSPCEQTENISPSVHCAEGAQPPSEREESTKPAAEVKRGRYYLMCERDWVYFTLIAVAGFFGAFTYLLRGNVFCNAQTGNVVLMGMALGAGKWK